MSPTPHLCPSQARCIQELLTSLPTQSPSSSLIIVRNPTSNLSPSSWLPEQNTGKSNQPTGGSCVCLSPQQAAGRPRWDLNPCVLLAWGRRAGCVKFTARWEKGRGTKTALPTYCGSSANCLAGPGGGGSSHGEFCIPEIGSRQGLGCSQQLPPLHRMEAGTSWPTALFPV